MSETERLLRQYDMVLHGDAWHGDAIWKILDDISAECAAYRPLSNTHTIWEIMMHMTFWEEVGARRLAGERAGLDENETLNFPRMPAITEANWRQTLKRFRASNEEFGTALSNLDAACLDELTAAGKRTFYDEAHGVIQHNVYHAGQIALLKKDFAERRASGGL
jgi:uncharacterized damage-inducible protein DinB